MLPAPSLPAPPDTRALARAARLLRAPQILVEIDWLQGCRPSDETQRGIREFLERYAHPARGVRIVLDEEIVELAPGVPLPATRELSEIQILDLALRHRSQTRQGDTESIYLLFVPRRAPDGQTRGERGQAWVADAFAFVAVDTVRGQDFLAIRGEEIERFVTQHELGHLLGLVSNGSHEREGHCTNPACIMYGQPDLRAALANWWRAFSGRLPTELDEDCARDLDRLRASAQPRVSATMSSGARNARGIGGPHAARG